MASSTSKPTGIHIALVIFVMSTLILALVCYLNMKEFATVKATADAATSKANREAADRRTVEDEVVLLKKKLGYADFEAIGTEGDNNRNTVVGALNGDLALHGKAQVQPSPANPNVAATLQSLSSALAAAESNVAQRETELKNLAVEMAQEQQAHARRLSEIQDSQTKSESQLQELTAQRNELVSEKDREIAKWREEFRREQREKEGLRDELNALRTLKDQEAHEFERSIANLREKLDKLEDLSFDKADGEIRRVDNTTRNVWINLGSADGVRPQVTFSIYTKGHNGLGRGNKDIKGKIEVTRVLNEHLSEARILSEDGSRPIQEKDPIYSPAWSKGRKEYFSFVGIVDMNGDGESDRELLRNILQNSNAGIEVEIDDQGNRIPSEDAQLTVKSKFLIVGPMEDPTDFPGSDSEKIDQIRKVMKERDDLTRDAMRKGIKTVNFNDFLNYIGYEQQQRLQNKDSKGYTLKSGTPPSPEGPPGQEGGITVPTPSGRYKKILNNSLNAK